MLLSIYKPVYDPAFKVFRIHTIACIVYSLHEISCTIYAVLYIHASIL